MMHGRWKSDPRIVPGKPPNKAEFVAAEAVEGRGGAKGNAVLSSTHQTQSWASIPGNPYDGRRRRAVVVGVVPLLHLFVDELLTISSACFGTVWNASEVSQMATHYA